MKALKTKARDIMTADLLTVTPATTLTQYARILTEDNISGCPVVTVDGRLVGIASKTDLLARLLEGRHDFASSPDFRGLLGLGEEGLVASPGSAESSEECTEEPLNPKYAKDYLGGTGLGVRMIYDEVPPSTDPLSPENKIVFTVGPVTATNYPSGARYQIVFKSPLTGILCDASSGGYWGADLKRAWLRCPDD